MTADLSAFVLAVALAWLVAAWTSKPSKTPIFGWLTKGKGGAFGISVKPVKRKKRSRKR